ncbi:MAG TPA: heme o synthase [Bacteroidota bacterium]|nr:heme o synthase [Bacteroidota bacterium]
MSNEAELVREAYHTERPLWRTAADYIELMKPELTSLSVLTALCSFIVAHTGVWDGGDFAALTHLVLGTMFLGGGAGTLNQYLERRYDRMMKRTENRPLAARRLAPEAALLFGIVLASIGLIELAFLVNPLTGCLGIATLLSYIFLYTPMKRLSPVATTLGGIPGAIPPLMGWAAARNELSYGAFILFAILFLWQMPHFFSLGWLYRRDYARAGFKLLTVVDESGSRTSLHILANCAALIPISLMPSVAGMTSTAYFVGALVGGMVFLAYAVLFAASFSSAGSVNRSRSSSTARRLFFASLIYLPSLFFLMVLDKV